MSKIVRVCVIICTRNRAKSLYITLKSILQNSLLPQKIIVIDSSNEENKKLMEKYVSTIRSEIKKRKVSLELIYHHDRSLSLTQARNYALKYTKDCDIIGFLDDDVVLHQDYIYNVVNVLKNTNIHGAQGLIINFLVKGRRSDLFVRILRAIAGTIFPILPYSITKPSVNIFLRNKYPLFPKFNDIMPSEWLSGSNMFYCSEIFYKWNYRFDTQLIKFGLGEDLDFSYTLSTRGFRLVLVPTAWILHKPYSKMNNKVKVSIILMTLGYRLYLLKKHYRHLSDKFVLTMFLLYSLPYIFIFVPLILRQANLTKLYIKCLKIVFKLKTDLLNLNLEKLNKLILKYDELSLDLVNEL